MKMAFFSSPVSRKVILIVLGRHVPKIEMREIWIDATFSSFVSSAIQDAMICYIKAGLSNSDDGPPNKTRGSKMSKAIQLDHSARS